MRIADSTIGINTAVYLAKTLNERRYYMEMDLGIISLFVVKSASKQRWQKMMLKSDCPCKDCTSRHPSCHASCSGYAEFKQKRATALANERAEKYDKAAYVHRVIQRSYGGGNKK